MGTRRKKAGGAGKRPAKKETLTLCVLKRKHTIRTPLTVQAIGVARFALRNLNAV